MNVPWPGDHWPPAASELVAEGLRAERAGKRRDARAHFERALHCLEAHDRASLAIALFCWIGRTHADDGDVDAANDCYEAALAAALLQQDRIGVARVVTALASLEQLTGNLDEAERLHARAVRFARIANDSELIAHVNHQLGVIAATRGDHEQALRLFGVALGIYRRLGFDGPRGQVLNHIGASLTQLRRFASAERSFAEAAQLAREVGDVGLQIALAVNRAEMCVVRRRFADARLACDLAVMRAEQLGERRTIGDAYRNYGVIARELGDYANAERFFTRALQVAHQQHNHRLAALTSREQAELFWRQERNSETLGALTRANRLFEQLRARRDLRNTRRRMGQLESMFLEVVRRWGATIESKDHYTRGHCDRVANYVCSLARLAGIDDDSLFWLRTGALLHDVGKLVVPSDILNKPGPLDATERVIMETHPAAGVELLAEIDFPWDIRPMVRHHHERWDGTGYPDRIAGTAIPIEARILCIADVWDALTTDRPYRPAFSFEHALGIMVSLEGRAFDPRLFRLFLTVIDSMRTASDDATTTVTTPAPLQVIAS